MLAALTATGCSSADHTTPLEHGHSIFVRSCAGCHTLSGRERGAAGGDLAIARLRVADLASFARVMPVQPPLSRPAARAVAEYIFSVARSTRPRGQ